MDQQQYEKLGVKIRDLTAHLNDAEHEEVITLAGALRHHAQILHKRRPCQRCGHGINVHAEWGSELACLSCPDCDEFLEIGEANHSNGVLIKDGKVISL